MKKTRLDNAIISILMWGLIAVANSAVAASLPDFTELAEANSAAVVNISTTQKVKQPMHGLPPGMEIPEDSPWGDFLRRFFGDGEGGDIEEFDARSLGSGFIIDTDGYVVTNYHVVKDAAEIIVRLSDRREYPAEIVGSDERSDIALLRIEAKDLPIVKLGKSAGLKVGEWVMAIGSPFGFEHSVSVGVVSALGRSLPRESYVPFIQTDVAINPGNSGGPLFNLDGEVVGINSQIYSRTGGFMGLSFAIPIDTAIDVVSQLKGTGHVTRGWLGVLIQDVNRDLAESFGMDKPMGAVVLKVLPDSPAAEAGLKVGDVVVEFNGEPISYSSDLPVYVGRTKVGSKAKARLIREGKPMTVSITIGELPPEDQLALGQPQQSRAAPSGRLGIVVEDLSAEQRRQTGVEDSGVIVKDVMDGAAREAGINSGDVIVMFDGVNVKNAAHFKKLVDGVEAGRSIAVLVQRRGGPAFLALRVPPDK